MRELSYADFHTRLYERTKNKARLLEVVFETTYNCNLSCRHCYLPPAKRAVKKNSELNLSGCKGIIDELFSLGCLNIELTGGEFFTRSDAKLILEYLRPKGFRVSIQTNGTLLSPEIIDLLAGFNPPVELSLPIYSLSEKLNRQIVGVAGALGLLLRNIERLRRKNIRFSLGVLVMRENFKEFDRIKDFAKDKGAHFNYDYLVQPRIDGNLGALKYQLPLSLVGELRKENSSSLRQVDNCQGPKERFINKEPPFYCSAGKASMAITPQGKGNLCQDIPFPGVDLLKEGVLGGWCKVAQFTRELKPEANYQCPSCEVIDFCSWCPAMGWRHKKDLFACVPIYKKLATFEKEDFYAKNKLLNT